MSGNSTALPYNIEFAHKSLRKRLKLFTYFKMTLNIEDECDPLNDACEAIKQYIIERGESSKVLRSGQTKLYVVVCL